MESRKRRAIKFFSVNNFDRTQHYKNRQPPWIKLYNELLDDPAFVSLSLSERFIYCALLLLASRLNNRIPYDTDYLQNALHTKEKINLTTLFSEEFLLAQSGKSTLAQSPRSAFSQSQIRDKEESERETQGEGDRGGGGCLKGLSQQEREVAMKANEDLKKARLAAGLPENGNRRMGSPRWP